MLLARLQRRIEAELGITVSVGLSHNKFLAKIASEQDKPRGFIVIGRAETEAFLARQPVALIWGVGRAAVAALEAEGIRTIADLRARDRKALIRRFGTLGDRLWRLAHGDDTRAVTPDQALKSISHETTFDEDTRRPRRPRAGTSGTSASRSPPAPRPRTSAGAVVTLKLKRADFGLLTRRQTLDAPTQMADRLYRDRPADAAPRHRLRPRSG